MVGESSRSKLGHGCHRLVFQHRRTWVVGQEVRYTRVFFHSFDRKASPLIVFHATRFLSLLGTATGKVDVPDTREPKGGPGQDILPFLSCSDLCHCWVVSRGLCGAVNCWMSTLVVRRKTGQGWTGRPLGLSCRSQCHLKLDGLVIRIFKTSSYVW